VVVRDFFLVLLDAPIELVGKRVNGGIHVLFDRVGVNRSPAEHHSGLGLVAQFFDPEYAVNVDDPVGVPDDPIEFSFDVILEGRGDIDMVTSDIQLHDASCGLEERLAIGGQLWLLAAF
jgi:hypothetical protein